MLFTGRLTEAAARRYVQATAGCPASSVVMVVDPPLNRPAGAAVFEAAGWSVVLVSCWTDVDAAWLALRGGGTLMAPRPPAPGTTQLGMDEMMRRTPRRTTA